MKRLLLLCAMLLVFLVSGIANAILYDRGGGLIYDDVLNITWLQDADFIDPSDNPNNFSKPSYITWPSATAWVDDLVYQGYDDWRLPDAHNQDGSGPNLGYNVINSEFGHMFYNNLGGTPDSFPGPKFIDGTTGEERSFLKIILGGFYWTSTPYPFTDPTFPDVAYVFNFNRGSQREWGYWDEGYAWAVRSGDSSPVPEPSTIFILGSSLVILSGFGRKRFKK